MAFGWYLNVGNRNKKVASDEQRLLKIFSANARRFSML